MDACPYLCRHVILETLHGAPNHFPKLPEANGQRICQRERFVMSWESGLKLCS